MADWRRYLRELREIREQPEATAELSLRQGLVTLLRELRPDLTIFAEAAAAVGQPDLIVKSGVQVVGYGETKPPGTIRQLEQILDTRQLAAYRAGLPNLLLTDYLHFILLRDGAEVARTTLVSAADLDAGRARGGAAGPTEELLLTWLGATPAAITSPERLAAELARRARWLRDGIRAELRREAGVRARTRAGAVPAEPGPLTALLEFERANLISDLDEDGFADAFAQTVAYGLFVARFHSQGMPFEERTAMDAIPISTAFLRSAVRLLLDEATVPASVRWIVTDLVAVLRVAADTLIARAAAVHSAVDDAVIYFYEHFLEAFDADERTDRGVYYTYPPLVSYATRMVDDALVARFGIEGLADDRVRLLDPAVGTGTFLVAAAEAAIARVSETQGAALVPALIADHLLPHFFGFELLPAPYSIAHLKLGSFYAQAGRPLAGHERVGIFLTNTLADPINPAAPALPTIGALIAEARAADEVKSRTPLLVITGNPPWAVSSSNREHIGPLMADFARVDGEPLGERNVRPLDDDYLRFLRWSVWKLLEQPGAPGQGIIALVTNSSYLSRPLMRGVRKYLLDHFDEAFVLDLHGNRRDVLRGRLDENVFPSVKVGVAITVFVRYPTRTHNPARVFYRETRGRRQEKFDYLDAAKLADTEWAQVTPRAPRWTFLPRDADAAYDAWPSLGALMPTRSPGVITHRDRLSVAFSSDELLAKIRQFTDLEVPDHELKDRYDLGENPRWRLHARRQALGGIVDPALAKPLLFRPFDRRVIYDETNLVGDRREPLREHLARVEGNIALVASRSSTPEAPYVMVSRAPGTQALLSSRTLGAAVFFPLYTAAAIGHDALLPLHEDEQAATLNLDPGWLARLRAAYGESWSPRALLGYLYAVLGSDAYRSRFVGQLEDDFARVPFTTDPELFAATAERGEELVKVHLLEEPPTATPRLEGGGDLTVSENIRHDPATERLFINATQYLEPVPASIWETKVGGYPVLELWLRNRRGRRLSGDEGRELARVAGLLADAEPIRADLEEWVELLLDGETFNTGET